jgi:hypothetical protein
MDDEKQLREHAHPDDGKLLGSGGDDAAAGEQTEAEVHTGIANGMRPVTGEESGLGDDPDPGREIGRGPTQS